MLNFKYFTFSFKFILLNSEKTVYETVSEGNEFVEIGSYSINARAYLSRFNFNGTDQQKKTAVLSGGERNRLHLSMTLKDGGNVILLDEPTNDIDINTLRALEEGLENFAGCVLVISHDRWFIDRLATHILYFDGEGNAEFFEGNYSDFKVKRLDTEEEGKRKRFKNMLN